jgi:hypothetical protein
LHARASTDGIPPIRLLMTNRRSTERQRLRRRVGDLSTPYTLVSRAPDGRVQIEGFSGAPEYRRRLLALRSGERSVSLEELINLLDV